MASVTDIFTLELTFVFGALSHVQSLGLVGWVGFVFLLSCLVLDWL